MIEPAAASVSATCKDGTTYTGTTKSGACSGHKGVQSWDAAAASITAAQAKAAAAPVKAAATPAKAGAASTSVAAGGGTGKVWVNSASNVYHCFGSKFYGKTKAGAYMTEAEAKAKGGHADHGKACS
ncbi:MAG: hypothetical protein ABL885_06780 [Methylophilaceae bacterium]